ncbi:MAG: riboflavin biosynthesis protein RibF [Oscillospiraceae bacterium]|nr:riboflavin biosynthesis protein RibF [Oscillospiraceae bacterium]
MPENSTAVAMGLFDGVHFGHRSVIKRAVEIAEENIGIAPAVFTFETASVTSKGDNGVEYLLSRELKHELIGRLGVKYIYSPDFMNFKNLTAEEFVELVLCDKLMARYVICGEDFRFGKNASGNVEILDKLCRKRGITVIIVPPVTEDSGVRISSTMIRNLVKEGRISEANKLMGARFQFRLPVMYGHQIGRTLDFPTINQYLKKRQVMPKYGVYASVAEFMGRVYPAVTNIGMKPTVANTEVPVAESYIVGFDGDLYGETVKISLIDFIRPEVKFDSLEQLKNQIAQDVKKATEAR